MSGEVKRESEMITGQDLIQWGLKPGPVFKTALKILVSNPKGWGKDQIEVSFKQMLATPRAFVKHPMLSSIAKMIVDSENIEIEKKGTQMNDQGCPVTIYGEGMIEAGALSQINMAARLPVSVKAALMPDAHQGYGLPIGGVLATDGAVIPYAVGVDIGCRMQLTIFDMPGNMARGMRNRLENILNENTVFGAGKSIDVDVGHSVLEDDRFDLPSLRKLQNLRDKAAQQIGTSGSGNHFVEFGVFKTGNEGESKLAVLSHSGSRGVGFAIANLFTKIAMDKRNLPDQVKHLAWLLLSESEGQEYWDAMQLAGDFAKACHDVIHDRIRRALGLHRVITFENHHNFAWKEMVDGRELIVHRKGATPASRGTMGVIPGSMTTNTYLVDGKGNQDSICSSSHGAGRMMSRKAAKERYTMSALRDNLEKAGVTLIGGSVDECSMAYKDIDRVMEAQKDLVEIVGMFTPVVVRMAGEDTPKEECE